MIVAISSEGRVSLLGADDFKRFSVRIDAPASALTAIAGRIPAFIRLEDAETAWVEAAALRAFPDLALAERQGPFDGMLAAAARHGWVSADGTAIRSHIVWDGGNRP